MSDSAKNPVITCRSVLLMLAAVCCSSASLADTTLTFSSEGDSLPQTIAIGSGKLRIDSTGESTWMLYDLAQNAMYMVDDAKQQYYRIDQSQIEQLGQSLGNLTSQLDSALANLPPEQRAAAMAMMKDMLPGNQQKSAAPMIDVRATGKTDKVADIACSVHETWVAEQRKNEVCVADSDALDLSREDERTMRGMAQLMQELVDEVQNSVGDLLPENIAGDGLAQLMANGVPVRVHDYENGSSAELNAVSHDNIAASRFLVNDNYTKVSMDVE